MVSILLSDFVEVTNYSMPQLASVANGTLGAVRKKQGDFFHVANPPAAFNAVAGTNRPTGKPVVGEVFFRGFKLHGGEGDPARGQFDFELVGHGVVVVCGLAETRVDDGAKTNHLLLTKLNRFLTEVPVASDGVSVNVRGVDRVHTSVNDASILIQDAIGSLW
jgi:hypothetical protein